MVGDAKVIEIDLPTGRQLTVKLTGRATAGAKAILAEGVSRGLSSPAAGIQAAMAEMLPSLLRTGLVVGWRGFEDERGRSLPLQPDLLAELLTAEELDHFVGTIMAQVVASPAGDAATDLGLPDPTEPTPEPTSSTSSSAPASGETE